MNREEFLSSIYLNYSEFLRRLCRKKVGYLNQYEDTISECIQDTFVLAVQAYQSLEHHPNIGAWLVQTCLHRLIPRIQQLRFRQSQAAFSLDDETYRDCLGFCAVEDYLENYARHTFFEGLCLRLSAEEKHIFSEYFIQNKTMLRISVAMNLSENQVRYAIQRIRKKARKEFSESQK